MICETALQTFIVKTYFYSNKDLLREASQHRITGHRCPNQMAYDVNSDSVIL